MAPPSDSGSIEVGVGELTEMLDRLRLRRQAVETELSLLPAAPKSTRDIFQLCRGFERAFALTIDSTEYAAHIRNAFQDGGSGGGRFSLLSSSKSASSTLGLAAAIRALPLEKLFRLDPVKAVVRECDGFQPHLVSPELGLRKLVGDALAMVEPPVEACIHRIHAVLVSAAREAATKASLLADSPGLDARREALRLPAFERAVVGAATRALEGWRDEALKVARTIVEMERSYVTAAFFRQRTMERVEAMSGGGFDVDNNNVNALRRRSTNYNSDDSDDDDSSTESSPQLMPRAMAAGNASSKNNSKRSVPAPPAAGARGTDLKTGYLEKRIGEHSTRSSLPDAFRWQRRYFVLTESKGMLYYFKSPDDPPNYKGVLSLRDCRIDDLDADGSVRGGGGIGGGGSANNAPSSTRASVGAMPGGAGAGKYDLDGGASASSGAALSASTSALPGGGLGSTGANNSNSATSLLFRISHRDPTRAVYKNHASLVLRAESASEKFSWLARLRAAAANASAASGSSVGASDASSASSPRSAGPLASGAAKRAAANGGSADGGGSIGRRATSDATTPSSPPPPPPPPSSSSFSPSVPRAPTIPASGIGSALAAGVSSKLGPEPPYVYSSSSTSSQEQRDAFLEALGSDTVAYVRTVCATIAVTVPKAAVHCQVKRAQEHLLEALYAAVSSLPPDAAASLLAEDGDAGARRAAAAAQSASLAEAYGAAAAARESAVASGAAKVSLPASVVAIAGRSGGGGGGGSGGGEIAAAAAPPHSNGNGSQQQRPPRLSVGTSMSSSSSSSVAGGGGSTAPTPTATTSPSPMPRRRPPPAPPSEVERR